VPELGAPGHCTPAQPKALVRRLLRRLVVRRPVRATVEANVGWVSGAVTPLPVPPPMLRQTAGGRYEEFVPRVLALGTAGYQDREMARRFTAEGCRSARSARLPVALVGELRRARGQLALTEHFKTHVKREGPWTVCGLAQPLAVPRHWRYTRIRHGSLPANRPAVTGHDLIPDAPELLAKLRAQPDRCGYREEGTAMAWRKPG
jgi:hypothetical protein